MNRKLLLSLGAFTVVASPIVSVISCSTSKSDSTDNSAIIDEVYQGFHKQIKDLDLNFELPSSLDAETIDQNLSEEGLSYEIENLGRVFGIGDYVPADKKGVNIRWKHTKYDGPLGAVYLLKIRFSKSSGKMKTLEIRIFSKDHSTKNPYSEAVSIVRRRLSDKIKGVYRATKNSSQIDKLIQKEGGITIGHSKDIELLSDASIYDANDFANVEVDDLKAEVAIDDDGTKMTIETTLTFEIRQVGTVISEWDSQEGRNAGNAERKAYTVFGVISTAVGKKSEFAFTINSAYFTVTEKLEAEKARLISALSEENGIYKVGTTNDSNRLILPSEFINDPENNSAEKLGFDDSKKIYGCSYEYELIDFDGDRDDDGNKSITSNDKGWVDVKIKIEATSADGNESPDEDFINVVFVGFQSKNGALGIIENTITEVAQSLSEVITHNGKVISGKITSNLPLERQTKLPSELSTVPIIDDKGTDDKSDDEVIFTPTETPETLLRFIPDIIKSGANELVDVKFTPKEQSSSDIKGELAFTMDFVYKNDDKYSGGPTMDDPNDTTNTPPDQIPNPNYKYKVYDSIELILTGFLTQQEKWAKAISTTELVFDNEIIEEQGESKVYLNLASIRPGDNSIVEDPKNGTTLENKHQKALFGLLVARIYIKYTDKAGKEIEDLMSSGIKFDGYDGFEFITTAWSSSAGYKIRVRVKSKIAADSFTAVSEEIVLKHPK